MRTRAMMLTIVALVLAGLVIWRYTHGGPPGPKTWAACAAAIIAAAWALVEWRRASRPVVVADTSKV